MLRMVPGPASCTDRRTSRNASVRRAATNAARRCPNLQILKGWLGYGQLGLPIPNRRMLFLSGAGGSRSAQITKVRAPTRRVGRGRFADLRTAPLLSKAPSTGFEPAISCVTHQASTPGCSTRTVAPDGVEPRQPGCGPSVVAVGPRGCVSQVEPPGIAPGFPACGAGVVLLDHDPEAEARPPLRGGAHSNPQAAARRHLFSRQVPHPAG